MGLDSEETWIGLGYVRVAYRPYYLGFFFHNDQARDVPPDLPGRFYQARHGQLPCRKYKKAGTTSEFRTSLL